MYKRKVISYVRRKINFLSASGPSYRSLSADSLDNYDSDNESASGSHHSVSSTESSESERDSPKQVESKRFTDSEECQDGYLAVYVGREKRRFLVGAHYLNHYLFRKLLEKSAEQFGFDHEGGVRIACEVVLFEHLLWLIGTDDTSTRQLEMDELLEFYS